MGYSHFAGSDEIVLQRLENLASCLSARPAAYGVSRPDADNLQALVDAFQAAKARSERTETRTTRSIIDKDEARTAAVRFAQTLVRQIKANDGVTVADKEVAGVPLPHVGPRGAVPPPAMTPEVSVVANDNGVQAVAFAGPGTGPRGGRPYGVAALQLYCVVGPGIGTEKQATFVGAFTRSPVALPYGPEHHGQIATYYARWVNARQQSGPTSAPASAVVTSRPGMVPVSQPQAESDAA